MNAYVEPVPSRMAGAAPDGTAKVWPVDGHVHFHNVARVEATLDAAARNFTAAVARADGLLGVLLLTQASREAVFEQLVAAPSRRGAWTFEPLAAEPETLLAHRDGATIAIVCGRQVRAQSGLEVLALGTTRAFADGDTFEDTLREVLSSGALTVLPWGFGKWLGARGKRVHAAITAASAAAVAVGDNGSRLAAWGVPRLVQESARLGFRVLPGTDPFPFGSDYRRVGGFGFLAETRLDAAAPWRSLRAWLDGLPRSPRTFGAASGPVQFVANQVGMQLYNRFVKRAQP